jgi:hypothetical protein
MEPSSPSQNLADRLRGLRLDHWPASKLTQKELGTALGGNHPLSTAAVASWENKSAPKLPPRDRMSAYAQFFATPRSMEAAPHLVPLEDFTTEERAAYDVLCDELFRLHAAARGTWTEVAVAARSWSFSDNGPLTLVCPQLPEAEASPLADPANINHTTLLGFGDLDAMFELWGHVRMVNPHMEAAYKSAARVEADDLSGHVVIIGGIGWNEVTRRILELAELPVTQRDEPSVQGGDIFVAHIDGTEKPYFPVFSPNDSRKLTEDIGLLVRMPNPLNSNRTLTMCNGIYSRGVLGAVRTLTDKRLRESNERYIARHFSHNQQFGILMRVQVIEGVAMTPDFNTDGTVLYQWPSASGTTQADASRAQARR